ncbi:MAG: protein phosphatase 2C domain-containing protein [Proteobacteria bacterium]|nr:protein phosphatase 2C domain-containing protein [Pseudomonadota bacterium]
MASEFEARVQLRAAMQTDVGVVRDRNEDAAHVDPKHCFFIVADGMGGHAAGEVASAMAVDQVREALERARDEISAFSDTPDEDKRKALVKVLEQAVRTAHQSVYERGSRETDKQGMGTTLDVVLVAGHEAFVAHVGDSRTYLIREGKANQITTDHTVAEVLVIEGKLSLEEAQISPLRTILVNAIGVAQEVGIEMAHVQLRKGDQLLLCSDGLHDYFPVDQELADQLNKNSPVDALAELVAMAKERGGHDNITGIVIDIVSCEPGLDAPLSAEITQKLPSPGGIPDEIDRDDTVPVERLEDDGTGKKAVRRKKRKRSQKSKRKARSKDAKIRIDDESKEKSAAATRTTDPMDAVSPHSEGDGDRGGGDKNVGGKKDSDKKAKKERKEGAIDGQKTDIAAASDAGGARDSESANGQSGDGEPGKEAEAGDKQTGDRAKKGNEAAQAASGSKAKKKSRVKSSRTKD